MAHASLGLEICVRVFLELVPFFAPSQTVPTHSNMRINPGKRIEKYVRWTSTPVQPGWSAFLWRAVWTFLLGTLRRRTSGGPKSWKNPGKRQAFAGVRCAGVVTVVFFLDTCVTAVVFRVQTRVCFFLLSLVLDIPAPKPSV